MGSSDGLARVCEFLREWDPIGVEPGAPDGAPPDEYDSYAPHILRLLAEGETAKTIAVHLERIRMESMGIHQDSAADLTAATTMVQRWATRPNGA
jgi:hypothetical protein